MARFEEKVYKEIDSYLRGDMTPEQRMDYEIKLSLDPELEQEVRFQDFIARSLAYSRRRQLHKYLFENASTKLWGNSWGRTGTIVSLIVVLLAGIAFFVVNSQRTARTDLPDKDDTRLQQQQQRPATPLPLDTAAAGQDTLAAPADSVNKDIEGVPSGNNEPEPQPKPRVKEPEVKPTETADPSDTIRGDVMLRELVLSATKLEQDIIDTMQLAGSDRKVAPVKYRLQFWESPVNFRGYKVEQKKITVYGLEQSQKVQLRQHGENLYLITGGQIYELQQTQSFRPLRPMAPPQSPNQDN